MLHQSNILLLMRAHSLVVVVFFLESCFWFEFVHSFNWVCFSFVNHFKESHKGFFSAAAELHCPTTFYFLVLFTSFVHERSLFFSLLSGVSAPLHTERACFCPPALLHWVACLRTWEPGSCALTQSCELIDYPRRRSLKASPDEI